MGMLGHRRSGATELFASGGWVLAAQVPRPVAVVLGLVIHALWMLLWSLLLVSIARQDRGIRAALAAIAVAALAFVASLVLPAVVLGPLSALTTPERGLIHIMLATSFMIGMPLALGGDPQGSR